MRDLTNLLNSVFGTSSDDWLFGNNVFDLVSKSFNNNFKGLFNDEFSTTCRTAFDDETNTFKIEYTANNVLKDEERTDVIRRYIKTWFKFANASNAEKVKLTFVFTNKDRTVKRYVFFYTKGTKVFECANFDETTTLKNLNLDCVKFTNRTTEKAKTQTESEYKRPTATFTTYAESLRANLKERRSNENIEFLCQEIKSALDNNKFLEMDDCVKVSFDELSKTSLGVKSKLRYVTFPELEKELCKKFGFSKAHVYDNAVTLYF